LNDFYEFLGLNNPQIYRCKMREYNNNISTTRSIENLNLSKNINKSISSGERTMNRSRSFIELEKINIKKNERLQKELMEEEKMKNKLYKEKIKLFNINNQRLKITVDRKSKQKSYLELMKEQQEEKSEIISMHNHQKNILMNKLKERELKKIKDKEREKKLKNYMINNFSKDESKEQFQLNEISEIKKEKDEDYEKRNDKNQIWWSKLEKYNIEDLGMNEEEKELFINSELISDENYNKDNNNNVNNNANNNLNQNNNNNSFGALISDNSLIKSNSKGETESNIGNKIENNNIKNKNIKPIQLPLINSSKKNYQKEKEKYNKNKSDVLFKTNQNNKDKTIDAMKNRNYKF